MLSCAAFPKPQLATRDIISRVADSTVQIETDSALGSGTVVRSTDSGSYVLSCWHVVDDAKAISVSQVGDNERKYIAIIEESDTHHDLVLLFVPQVHWDALPIAPRGPELYERVISVSSPLGFVHTAADGIISNTGYASGDRTLYQVTSFTAFGSSGGTVANLDGELIGVPQLIIVRQGNVYTSLGFLITLRDIRTFLHM
jgi:S1-C subfamily serine protease